MNTKILQKISYGLFVVTTSFEGKDTGCIINTACQVATEMNAVSISVNKANYTCEMIQKAKRFNISVIDQSATFDLFKHFGFQSGRDTDKFAGFNDCKRTANGCMAVTKGTNAFFSVSVIKEIDLGSHILFVGIPSDGEFFSEIPSATYEYYFENIKPKPEAVGKTSDGQTIWRCVICGYEYVGEELPEDFICPICKHPASDFEKVTK